MHFLFFKLCKLRYKGKELNNAFLFQADTKALIKSLRSFIL